MICGSGGSKSRLPKAAGADALPAAGAAGPFFAARLGPTAASFAFASLRVGLSSRRPSSLFFFGELFLQTVPPFGGSPAGLVALLEPGFSCCLGRFPHRFRNGTWAWASRH